MLTLIGNGHPLQEISIKALSGYLDHNNIPVRTIFMSGCPRLSPTLIKRLVELSRSSLLVGFSLMSKDVSIFLPAIRAIKKELNIPIVLGGIHPTALPEKSLEFSDFVCVGEGEEPLKRLYKTIISNSNDYRIQNIIYKQNGSQIHNPATYFTKDLDELPFPDYGFRDSYMYFDGTQTIKKIPHEPKNKHSFFKKSNFLFYSQRGCRLACTYCSNSIYHSLAKTAHKKWYRTTSPKRIKEELGRHLNAMPFIKSISINDDDFLERSVEEIKEITNFLKIKKLPFGINGIPSLVNEEKIKILAKNGLVQVSFGVQSGSKRILLKIFKRAQTNEQVLNAAKIVHKFSKYGVSQDFGFILDNPYETDNDWRDSLRLITSLPKPRSISLYSLEFFPGTKLTELALHDGYINNLSQEFNKDYRKDIKYTYPNALFFLNSYFNFPKKITKLLISDYFIKSKLIYPLRFIFAYPIRFIVSFNKNIPLANRNLFRNYIFKLAPGLYYFLKNIYKKIR